VATIWASDKAMNDVGGLRSVSVLALLPFCRLIYFVFFGSVWFLALGVPSAVSQDARLNTFQFTGNIAFSDLPSGLEKRPPPGSTPDQIDEILTKQPNLILDGATLDVTAPTAGLGRTLMINTLELRRGASIRIHGVNLEINARVIVSDGGKIEAFTPADDLPNRASDGQNGAAGLNAGTLVLDAALDRNDLLNISLSGQNGQQGGAGLQGPQGVPGPRGDNGADHLFDCARGGGNGGNGSQGGKGGTGGTGGRGGDGGKLILRGKIAAQRFQVTFSAPGGRGGVGGTPGPGGVGGAGGSGGSGTTYCRGGSAGAPGPRGPTGEPGSSGENGQEGAIFAG
jgi:hypothetical protein